MFSFLGQSSVSTVSSLLAAAALIAPCFADNITDPLSTFYSRPDITAPAWEVSLFRENHTTPGYIFISPYKASQTGPYIYDYKGNLVWSGFGTSGGANAHDFHPCEFQGKSNHLCYVSGQQMAGFVRGTGVVMDSGYNIVRSVKSGNGRTPNDQHEFNMMPGGETVLMTLYEPVQYDLTQFGVRSGQGWLMQGIAQEVNTATGEVVWEWKSLDHVPPTDSYVAPGSIDVSGNGLHSQSPWDYFHINAVDKTPEGNYLISSRHTSTIFCVGPKGNIIWKLNGYSNAASTFDNTNFNFSSQHNVRYLDSNSTSMTISFFNNANDGYNATMSESVSMIVVLRNDTTPMTATMINRIASPSHLLTRSQGNTQVLDNGNIFTGWGSYSWVSEHTPDGHPVFFARFSSPASPSYRAYKANFTGNPIDLPAVYAYSELYHNVTVKTYSIQNITHGNHTIMKNVTDTHSEQRNLTNPTTRIYMSWNGCTECHSWNIHTSRSAAGPFTLARNIPRTGFESMLELNYTVSYVVAEALDKRGVSLASSTPSRTFMPGPELSNVCDGMECANANSYAFHPLAFGDTVRATYAHTMTDVPSAAHTEVSAPVTTDVIAPPMRRAVSDADAAVL